jgi:uncharacterized protein (TIGR02266 family)
MSIAGLGTQRRHDRIRTRLEVRYGEKGPEHTGTAESISEGGLYINTNEVYPVATRIVLEVSFPERTVRHRGEVVWAIHVPEHLRSSLVCGMGVRFIDPDPQWHVFFHRWKAVGDAG